MEFPFTTSFWATPDVVAENPLRAREIVADVAVVGAGYAGMSAAYYIKKAKPETRVVVIEKQYAGFGPSGRNFGAVVPGLRELRTVFLTDLDPAEEAFAQDWYMKARGELERRIAESAIECEYRREPLLMVSVEPEAWEAQQREARLLEVRGTPHRLLNKDDVARAMSLPFEIYGGIARTEWCAVQPFKLARGLRRQLVSMGVEIFEGTSVEGIEDDGSRVTLRTLGGGTVHADKAVLATNAYTVHLPPVRDMIFPRHTNVLATEPLPDDLFQSLGFREYKFIEDAGLTFYYARVYQNRLLMGGGPPCAGLFTPSTVDEKADRSVADYTRIYEEMQCRFPQLEGVRIDAAWAGPTDMTENFMPVIAPVPQMPNVISSIGYSGDGLLNASITGKMVKGLVLGADHVDPGAERIRRYMLRV